jgi:hypothetical protein
MPVREDLADIDHVERPPRHRTPASATRGIILAPDDQVHPDTHVLTMVNNLIGVVNYVIAARASLLNFVITDSDAREHV